MNNEVNEVSNDLIIISFKSNIVYYFLLVTFILSI